MISPPREDGGPAPEDISHYIARNGPTLSTPECGSRRAWIFVGDPDDVTCMACRRLMLAARKEGSTDGR